MRIAHPAAGFTDLPKPADIYDIWVYALNEEAYNGINKDSQMSMDEVDALIRKARAQ